MASDSSYTLSESNLGEQDAGASPKPSAFKPHYQDPSMDSLEGGDLLNAHRSPSPSPAHPPRAQSPLHTLSKSPQSDYSVGFDTSSPPSPTGRGEAVRQSSDVKAQQQRPAHSPLASSLESSLGGVSGDLIDQGHVASPYAMSAPYAPMGEAPVSIRSHGLHQAAMGAHPVHSSDYSSGSFGITADASSEGGWVPGVPAVTAPAHHPSNPYSSAVPQSPYHGSSVQSPYSPYSGQHPQSYQGTSPSATPSSAVTFQHWQQNTPSSTSHHPYQYAPNQSRLSAVTDDSYDHDYEEDNSSLQEGHGALPYGHSHVGGFRRDSTDHRGDISFRGGISLPTSAGTRVKKGKKGDQNQNFDDTMKGRLEAAVAEACKRHVSTWDVLDVCNWVEAMGFLQYRKKFSHNSIDGPLLIELTDDQMRKGLSILPLGHRETIKRKIQELKQMSDAFGEDASTRRKGKADAGAHHAPRMPASASPNVIPAADSFLGPAQGKMTIKEQRNRLNYELDRMANKAAQAKALIEQLSHNKGLTDEEVRRLKGQLALAEAEYKASERRTGVAVDPDAAIPWRPNHFWTEERHPERFAPPGGDPEADLTFTPRITRISDLPMSMEFREIKDNVKHVYSLPKIWERMEKEEKRKKDMKEAVEKLEGDVAQEQNMESLNVAAADLKAGAKTAGGQLGYWIPGGIGSKHKLPKGSDKEQAVPDKAAHEMSKEVKFLEARFKEWQCEKDLGPKPGTNPREARLPYPELLEAVDDFIDALLTPGNDVIGTFPMAVKSFFKKSNLHLEPKTTDAGALILDPLLKRFAAMRGFEKFSELDEAKLKLSLLGKPKKKNETNTNPIADMILKRKCQKVKAAAGIIHMADFVRGGKQPKKGKGRADSSDDEEEKRAAFEKKKERKKSGSNKLPHGPWISNGILHRGIKAEGLVCERMGLFNKKMGSGNTSIETGKQTAEQSRAEALDRDAAKADQLFLLLGWHHAQPELPPGSNDPPPDVTGDLINKLLRRALAIAGRKDQQVDMTKQVKAHKAEIIRDLSLKLTKLHPKDPMAKELQSRLAKVKEFSMDIEPPPPVDFNSDQWRADGLEQLQATELECVRERLNKQWEKDRCRKHNTAMQAAQSMNDPSQVAEVDWTLVDQPGWEVEDLLFGHDHLTYCCNLLGQLPSSELNKFLIMHPSGLEEEQNGPGKDQGPGVGGLNLERYDANGAQTESGQEEQQTANKRKFETKALKLKKAKVFKAITTMKFVEFTDTKIHERDKKMANALAALYQERKSRQRVITPHEQESFFARLLEDINARRASMEERQIAQINHEKETMRHFRARPYSPRAPSCTTSSGFQSRQRSLSPGSGRSSPGAQFRAPSPAASVDGDGRGWSPSPRPGGGFAYWHASGSQAAPRARARASGQQQADALQRPRRPVSASATPRKRAAPAPGQAADASVEYAWPSGAPVDPQQRPRSAAAAAPRTPARGGGIQGHHVVGDPGASVGTFGQAAARPGGQRVDTSPQATAARFSPKRRSPHRGRHAATPGGEGRGGGDIRQWQQQALMDEDDGHEEQEAGQGQGRRTQQSQPQQSGGQARRMHLPQQHQSLISDSDDNHSRSPSPQGG